MKRKMLGILTAVAALSFAGCSSTIVNTEETEEITAENFEMTTPEGKLTYVGVEHGSGDDGKYVTVYFDYTNLTDKDELALDSFYVQVLQGEVELIDSSAKSDNEMVKNSSLYIEPNNTVRVGKQYTLVDEEKPLTIKMTDWSAKDVALELSKQLEVDIKQ